jgi:hypothetical protein
VTIYTIHAQPGDATSSLRLVPHRFSWQAFLFGPVWLAANRLWGAAALALLWDVAIVAAAFRGVVDRGIVPAALVLGGALIGLEGREWLRRRAMRRGEALCGVALGSSETEALLNAAATGSLGARESRL